MKGVLASAACILASGALFAQKPATGTKAAPAKAQTAAIQNANAAQNPIAKNAAVQNTAMPAKGTATTHAVKPPPNAVGGFIRDNRSRPIKGVKAFLYLPDSSIGASGYTDSSGFYQTNSLAPGKYNLKLVYPSNKAILVTGVPIKKGITPINFKANAPESDTTVAFADILPKPEPKKGEKKK